MAHCVMTSNILPSFMLSTDLCFPPPIMGIVLILGYDGQYIRTKQSKVGFVFIPLRTLYYYTLNFIVQRTDARI